MFASSRWIAGSRLITRSSSQPGWFAAILAHSIFRISEVWVKMEWTAWRRQWLLWTLLKSSPVHRSTTRRNTARNMSGRWRTEGIKHGTWSGCCQTWVGFTWQKCLSATQLFLFAQCCAPRTRFNIEPNPTQWMSLIDPILKSNFEDSAGVYQALPYEIAHGVVYTLVKHGGQLRDAKNLVATLEAESSTKPAKIEKAKQAYTALHNVQRHMVFNRRTGCLATSDWVAKHVQTNAEGFPVPKNASSTSKPWVMTLSVQIIGLELKVELRSSLASGFRRVRCFDLKTTLAQTKVTVLTGYEDILTEQCEDDEERKLPFGF